MENKCQICMNETSCVLKEHLTFQNQNGGCSNKDLDRKKGAGGPFWKESAWNGFAERVKQQANDKGCLHPNEVSELADKITAEKKEAGELL